MMKLLFYLAVASIVAASCNPQRKVQKAIKTVTYNDTAFAHVGRLWERFNPCANDTVSQPVFIEAELNLDSLRGEICDTTVQGGGSVVVPSDPTKPVVIKVPCNCPPTQYIRDVRHEQIIRDSLVQEVDRRRAADAEIRALRATVAQCQTEVSGQQKAFRKEQFKRTLIMFIPIAVLIALLVLAIKRPKIF